MRGLNVMRSSGPSRSSAPGRRARGTIGATVLAMCATALAFAGVPSASAAQAPGNDVPAWSTGWSWTYDTSFRYVGDGTDVTLNERVTYAVAGTQTFNGQPAYKLDISGNVTGGGGHTTAAGGVDLKDFSGSVSGTRYVRISDLSLLQEKQHQDLDASAKKGILSVGVDATVDLQLDPRPGWRTHDFPLNAGDSWHVNESIDYTGGFSYDAGSIASGSSPFEGSFPFNATSTVGSSTISVPIGSVATNTISASASTPDGVATDNLWWSPAHRNDAKERMVLPLDGATLTIDRNLRSASTPPPSSTLTAAFSDTRTCAGDTVTVTGKVGNASGTPVRVALDKSQINPGQQIVATTATTANGNYSTTIRVPAESDGLNRSGARASWGVLVTSGTAAEASTIVVTPKDCTALSYVGETSAPRGTTAIMKAQLTDLAGASVAGKSVRFTLGGNSATANTSSTGLAVATLPVGNTVGTLPVKAEFAGTSSMEPASDATTFTVGKVDTITSASPASATVDVGDPITFSADVTSAQAGGGTPAGTVQFVVDGASFGAAVDLVDGSATSSSITYAAGDEGTHHVEAVYSGNGDFNGSSSAAAAFTVMPQRTPSSTSLTVDPTTSVSGQDVTLSATVASTGGGTTPTGEVTFKRGATVLGHGALDDTGTATLTTADLPVGSNQVTAVYGGDAAFKSSTSAPRAVTVSKAESQVDLSSAKSPTVTGEAVELTASVGAVAPGSGVPGGTVQLEVDGNPVGSPAPLENGTATFPPVTALGAGSHTITAQYAGDGSFDGDSDSLQQVVGQADTTTTVVTSPEVTNEGVEFTITAVVVAEAPGSGDPDGTIAFTADGNPIGTATVVDGQALITSSDLAPGNHAIAATYSGSADYTASTSDAVNHTVIEGAAIVPTSLALSSSTNPATYGELISFSAQVTADDGSTPTGGVQFSVDGTDIGGPVPVGTDGTAVSATIAAPEPGDHTVFAAFVADAGYAGSGALLTQTVQDATVTIGLSSSDDHSDYGQGVTFTADVASDQVGTQAPTGFVQFRVDGQPLGGAVAIADGSATSASVDDLAPGAHTVTATYAGDEHFFGATEALTQQVAKIGTTTTLAVSATSITYGQDVDLTATVTPDADALGVPSGTVTFKDGATTLATAPVGADGKAHVIAPTLGGGEHAITATYSGSAMFATSTSGAKQVGVARMTTYLKADAAVVRLIPLGLPLGLLKVTLRGDQGQPLAGQPIEFTIGSSSVCTTTTDADGVATCNARPLLLQMILHNGYSATFAGDTDHLPSSGRGFTLK